MEIGVRSFSCPGKDLFSITATLVLTALLDVTHASPHFEFEIFITFGKPHKNTKILYQQKTLEEWKAVQKKNELLED